MNDKTKMCSRCKVEHKIELFAIDPNTKKHKSACKKSNVKAGRAAMADKKRKVHYDKERVGEVISSAWM